VVELLIQDATAFKIDFFSKLTSRGILTRGFGGGLIAHDNTGKD
jgi:hypothetical protein